MGAKEMWVFGYGSLMWEPGFDHDAAEIALLRGYGRSFCMRSIHQRGTQADPGLVLALDEDANAQCEGLALRVRRGGESDTLAYLRERELISAAYLEMSLPITLRSGTALDAVTFVIDPNHVQYCGGLAPENQAAIIARSVGGRGPNSEYLFNTVAHLGELGLHDPDLVWLADRVREILGQRGEHRPL